MTLSSAFGLIPHLPASVRLGEVIGGKYRLDRILGVGGMGVVVGAFHVRLDRRIAIKFMSPTLVADAAAVRRFNREARASARIESEHVVRVFDVGALDDGTPFIVMEYLEGQDLREMLEERGALPLAEAVDCVLQASEAIGEAHLAGVVHRDLKPGNLFSCSRPDGSRSVKVVDFGISKLLASAGATRTGATTAADGVLGSPLYCSPEQLRTPHAVDGRTDIWALGAILYELVAGTPPFTGQTLVEILSKVERASFEPLCSARSDVPVEFGGVVSKCLRRDPADRFQTVQELARALAPFAPPQLVSVQRIESPPSVQPMLLSGPECGSAVRLRGAVGPRHSRLRQARSFGIGLAVGLVVAGSLVLALRRVTWWTPVSRPPARAEEVLLWPGSKLPRDSRFVPPELRATGAPPSVHEQAPAKAPPRSEPASSSYPRLGTSEFGGLL